MSTRSVAEVISQQLFGELPSFETDHPRADLPAGLDGFFRKAMARRPCDRYQTVAELRRGLYDLFPEERLRRLPCRKCHRLAGVAASCAKRDDAAPYLDLAGEPCPEPVGRSSDELRQRGGLPTVNLRGLRPAAPRLVEPPPPELDHEDEHTPRYRERAAVLRFLRGPGRVLELIGPPGAGRSSLLAAAGRQAGAMGMKVLYGQADPELVQGPWGPARRMLAALLLQPGELPSVESLEAGAMELGLGAGDLPGLMDIFGIARESADAGHAARFREAVAAARRTLILAGRLECRQTLLLLDDVHLYDTPSLRVIQVVCEQGELGADVKVMLASEGAVLPGTREGWPLNLGPLTTEEVRSFARGRAGSSAELSSCDAAALRRVVGPSLLHLSQALAYLDEGGPGDPPATLDRLVTARLPLLPSPERQLVELEAVASAVLTDEEVASVLPPLGADPEALRARLTRLSWLADEHDDVGTRFHPLLGILVRKSTPGDRLTKLHRAVYRCLEERGEHDIFKLAAHAYAGSMGQESFDLQGEAASAAQALLDLESAGQIFLMRAVSVGKQELGLTMEDPRMLEVALQQAEALAESGHHLAAEDALLQLLELVRQGSPALRARALLALAHIKGRMGEDQLALEALEEAAGEAARAEDEILLSQACNLLGEALLRKEADAPNMEPLVRWISLLEAATEHPPGFYRLRLLLATAMHRRGDMGGALQEAQFALEAAHTEGTLAGEARSRLVLGQLTQQSGQLRQAEEHLAMAHLLHVRLGDRMGAARSLSFMASRHVPNREVLVATTRELERQVLGRRPT